jgi:hypothetical protein
MDGSKMTTHGLYKSHMYKLWSGVKNRCCNPKTPAWKRYGGRGISICDRWKESFENFLADMGERPFPKAQIDRIDNDGDYEPSNCRWVTPMQNLQNKSNNKLLEFNGQIKTQSVWARELNLDDGTLYDRLDKGWSIERALGTPHRKQCNSRSARQWDSRPVGFAGTGEE